MTLPKAEDFLKQRFETRPSFETTEKWLKEYTRQVLDYAAEQAKNNIEGKVGLKIKNKVQCIGDFIAGAKYQEAILMNQLLDDIEMNLDDWCRTPLVMATKFRDKQSKAGW